MVAHCDEASIRLSSGCTNANSDHSPSHDASRSTKRPMAARTWADRRAADAATVLAYLRERSGTIASITLRKDAMGIRRWHQADVLPDPTDHSTTVLWAKWRRPGRSAILPLRRRQHRLRRGAHWR